MVWNLVVPPSSKMFFKKQEKRQMKKQYTKKQITEAIAYWKKQLKSMNESGDISHFSYYVDNRPKEGKFELSQLTDILMRRTHNFYIFDCTEDGHIAGLDAYSNAKALFEGLMAAGVFPTDWFTPKQCSDILKSKTNKYF